MSESDPHLPIIKHGWKNRTVSFHNFTELHKLSYLNFPIRIFIQLHRDLDNIINVAWFILKRIP